MSFPHDPAFDATAGLLKDPYRYVARRCARLGSDVFVTRVLLRRTICMMGAEAARTFYLPDRITRRGAIPLTALLLLQDRGSAATLDGAAHRHRKLMLMSLMAPARIRALSEHFAEEWRAGMTSWQRAGSMVVARDVPAVLTRAVCRWAGVPVRGREARRRTRELRAMYEGAGTVGPRNWKAQLLRSRTERWARSLIERIRLGEIHGELGTPVEVIAAHRDLDGTLLPVERAAVELINLLRPTVAVERYITFMALALHQHPLSRVRIAIGDAAYLDWFIHEVRRFYPFVPMVGGRVLTPFEWRGHRFRAGDRVLLDIHGTNHDPRSWDRPDVFHPERFRDWRGNAFSLIPQGGGDHYTSHRCAGEWLTLELMRRAALLLAIEMRYKVPPQDLTIDMTRMPAIPRSGVRLAVSGS